MRSRATEDLYSSILKHKIAVGIIIAVSVACSVLVACTLTPMFEATAFLIIGQPNPEGGRDTSRTSSEVATSLMRVAESDEVIRRTVQAVGIRKLEERHSQESPLIGMRRHILGEISTFLGRNAADQPPRDEDPIQRERLIRRTAQNLNVKIEPNSDVMRISFRHSVPTTAADFTNQLAQVFIDRQISLYNRPGAVEFYEKQKEHFNSEFMKASAEFGKFSGRSSIYDIDDQKQLLLKRITEISASIAATRGALAEKNGQKEALVSQLRRLKPVTQSPYVSSLVESLATEERQDGTGRANVGRAAVPDERLPSDAPPPLLMVKVYQDTMVMLFKTNSDIRGLTAAMAEQEETLRTITNELRSLSDKQAEYSRLKNNVAQAAYNVETYSRREVEEKISADMSRSKLSNVKIFQTALVPLDPVSPNIALFAAFGAILGLCLGGAFAFSRGTTAVEHTGVHPQLA